MALGVLIALPAAAVDVQGRFDGKVACTSGKKEAEFKAEGKMTVTHSSSQEIKRRIDTLTWPSGNESLSFSDREKEKVELQHALKLLRDLSCEDKSDPGTTVPDPTNTLGGANHKQ